MRLQRLVVLLPFILLLAAPTRAQETSLRGTYLLSFTIDGTRYKLPATAYSITTGTIDGKSVDILSIWIRSADAKKAGLQSGSALIGKQAARTQIYREAAPGEFQKLALGDVRVHRVASGAGGYGGSDTCYELMLGTSNSHSIISPRDAASGLPTGVRALNFTGKTVSLGGSDWE
jgi:hypothetical protein